LALVAWSSVGSALAQSPAKVPPTTTTIQPPTAQPAPGKLPPVGSLPEPDIRLNAGALVGKWIHTRRDEEVRSSDDTVIEFFADGRYTAKNRNSLSPAPAKPATGRYYVTNQRGNQFELRVERVLVEPESDKSDAVETQPITVVDRDTLMAADGSIVRRLKE
jgi:hypothetical protein